MTNAEFGTVVRSTGSWNTVRTSLGFHLECRLRGQFRNHQMRATNPIAVGDHVRYSLEDDGTGVITEILDRRNYIIRKSVNLSKEVHVIAANIDQALIIATVSQPRTSLGFIDRFLCVAEAYGIPAMVVLNKMDLHTEPEQMELNRTYEQIYVGAGYPVFQVSATKNMGIEDLKSVLKGKVSLVFGHSGVGKSTLLNAIQPELDLRTGEISDVHSKGKHTTTFAEMFELNNGGFVIDTPGVKEFGMVNMKEEELYHYFPEIFMAAADCKFGNCLHRDEPGCAVKQAVENGGIAESRYSNYISVLDTLA
jgi:ribosome biogenesis GTPase